MSSPFPNRYVVLSFAVIILQISQILSESDKVGNESIVNCICTEIYNPVCANNGKTYSNPCVLNCERRQDPNLLGLCEGECPCCKKPYYNEPLQSNGWGSGWGLGWMIDERLWNSEKIAINRNDKKTVTPNIFEAESEKDATPNCVCTLEYKPVCGSNNKTYGNTCDFECNKRTTACLTKACDGECPCCSCKHE